MSAANEPKPSPKGSYVELREAVADAVLDACRQHTDAKRGGILSETQAKYLLNDATDSILALINQARQPESTDNADGLSDDRAAASISTDGPNVITPVRRWLSRQLIDSRLDDEEAFGIVACHPSISPNLYASPAGKDMAGERLRQVTPELAAQFANVDGPWTRGQMEMDEVWSRLIDAQLAGLAALGEGA